MKKMLKQIADITDEEGLKLAYETNDGLYNIITNCLLQGLRIFQPITPMS